MDNIDLKKLRFENGDISQEELGNILGVTKQHISKIEKGKAKLTFKNIEILKNYFGLQSSIKKEEISSVCLSLPVNGNISPSYKNGIEQSENNLPKFSVSKKLIEDIGANPGTTEFIICEGDSMLPSIEAGALLMVDKSQTKILDGKLYCIRLNNSYTAKRLQFIPPNSLKVISDNSTKYDSFYINLSEKLNYDFAVIGEIKWIGTITK